MLNREDVERIVENVLSELSLNVSSNSFYSPNERKITLMYKDKILSETFLDVMQDD
jgi:hypothetical protein